MAKASPSSPYSWSDVPRKGLQLLGRAAHGDRQSTCTEHRQVVVAVANTGHVRRVYIQHFSHASDAAAFVHPRPREIHCPQAVVGQRRQDDAHPRVALEAFDELLSGLPREVQGGNPHDVPVGDVDYPPECALDVGGYKVGAQLFNPGPVPPAPVPARGWRSRCACTPRDRGWPRRRPKAAARSGPAAARS